MIKTKYIIFILVMVFRLHAQSDVVLHEKQNCYLIGQQIQFLHDKDQKLDFATVSSPQYSSKFTQSTAKIPNLGMGDTTYWLRFTIDNQSEQHKKWILEIKFFRFKKIILYHEKNGQIHKQYSGYFHLSQREIVHFYHALHLTGSQKTTYYLQVENTGPFFFPVVLWEKDEFTKNQTNEYMLSFFYLGIILALVWYNLFLFVILKDVCYLYYVTYIVSISLLTMCTRGFIFSFFTDVPGNIVYSSSLISGCLTIISLSSFSINFLNIPKENITHTIISTLRILGFLSIPLSFVHHHFVIFVILILGILNIITILVASFHSLTSGYKPARYFLYAWSALLVLVIQIICQRLGIISNYLTNFGFLSGIIFQFAIVWDAVFLSVSLADRVNTIAKEKENAQQETLQLKNTLNQQLEKQVKIRTHELYDANTTLKKEIEQHKKTEQALKKATQIKSDFLATMSHEIRTPMNAILGIAQLMNNTSLDDKQQNYVNLLNYSSQHLLSLINDVLDLSKLESGKFELSLKTFSTEKFLQETVRIFDIKMAEKNLNFICNVSPEFPKYLIGDSVRIKQVLINLISNAIKFTECGSITLSVETVSVNNDTAHIKFSVEDTGIGISQDKIENLFNSFVQINLSSTKEEQGTGLGLTISQKIIHFMHGKIRVESFENKGSTFHFTIPLKIDKTAPHEEQKVPQQLPRKKALSILLVEDCKTNRLVAIEFLKHLGHKDIDIVENGEEAIQKTVTKKYDLIFIDFHMPVMDGLEASKIIHERGNRPIIILLTADVFTETENLIQIDDKLLKPLRLPGLQKVLDKWIPTINNA
ncbi:hybrid sensor histidine kinase/response regulator [Candidatus Uabimicrobium amorphum]